MMTATTCDPATSITKSLLGWGVLAGPVYVAVSLVQAVTRDGFDLSRHSWSLLSTGSLGWVQVTNFILTGAMVLAGALGVQRALGTGVGAVWAPRLLGAYGLSLVAAGLLRADPGFGFPAGTPDGPGDVSWHGVGHLIAGAVGFACLIAACFVLARRFRHTPWAAACRVTGVIMLAAFAGIASGSGSSAAVLSFTAAVVLSWAWLSVTALRLYRGYA